MELMQIAIWTAVALVALLALGSLVLWWNEPFYQDYLKHKQRKERHIIAVPDDFTAENS